MSCTRQSPNTVQNSMSSQATSTTPSQPLSTSGCCESGRPIITDPLTGQTVCSCQYDTQAQQLLNYQRLASGLPLNMYGSPYAEQNYLPLTADQSAFYTPSEGLGTWPYPASMYYPYDPTLSGYPFANGYGMDLNGARRKNATRETTSTLKAWLNEHRKNPYPTKGEKIMLAIITKMTLTQVSTWFANARRRLKKDNKVTWEPRNRVDDDDNDDVSDTNERDTGKGLDKESKTLNENGFDPSCAKATGVSNHCDNSNCDRTRNSLDAEDDDVDVRDDDLCLGGNGAMDTSQRDSMSSPGSSILSDSHSSLQSPVLVESPGARLTPSGLHDGTGSNILKPRIWSIVDTATSHGNNNSSNNNNNNHSAAANSNFLGVGFGIGGSGLFATNGGPSVKVSQQLARNFRLGYASPYTKAAWLNGAFGTLNPAPVSVTTSSASTMAAAAAAPPSSPATSVSIMSTPPSASIPVSNGSTYPTSVGCATSQSSTSTTFSTVATSTVPGSHGAPTNGVTTPSAPSTSASYPMSIAAAAAAANSSMNVNSSLFSRTYAQTIHNLTNLTKGLNHLMTPQMGATSVMGSMKPSSQVQDQRAELQSSTS